MRPEPLPPQAEGRIPAFTELVATAIANAQAQAELTASRTRIVATADQTRRQIERDLHDRERSNAGLAAAWIYRHLARVSS